MKRKNILNESVNFKEKIPLGYFLTLAFHASTPAAFHVSTIDYSLNSDPLTMTQNALILCIKFKCKQGGKTRH